MGLVEHLLLLKGLEKVGMKEADVELVKVPTHQTAQSLASGDVDAIGAWQPNSGQALKSVAGSRAVWTSADVPGLIYDLLNVSPKSLAQRRADWVSLRGTRWRASDGSANKPRLQDHGCASRCATESTLSFCRHALCPEEAARFAKDGSNRSR